MPWRVSARIIGRLGGRDPGFCAGPFSACLPSRTSPTGAQPPPPPPRRDANIWNGEAHEPNPGNVETKERNAGIAPDAQQQQSLTNEVEHLDRKLERQAQ